MTTWWLPPSRWTSALDLQTGRAFDNSRERDSQLVWIAREIEAGQASGQIDRAERVSGVQWPVNYFRDARRSRIGFNALGRGVIIPDEMLNEL